MNAVEYVEFAKTKSPTFFDDYNQKIIKNGSDINSFIGMAIKNTMLYENLDLLSWFLDNYCYDTMIVISTSLLENANNNNIYSRDKLLFFLIDMTIDNNNLSFANLLINGLIINGKILHLQYFTSTTIMKISADNNVYFRLACSCGHLETAKWLFKNFGIDPKFCYNTNDSENCITNLLPCIKHPDIIKWLYSITKFNFRYSNDKLFNMLCNYIQLSDFSPSSKAYIHEGYVKTLKFLVELCQDYHIKFTDDVLTEHYVKNLYIVIVKYYYRHDYENIIKLFL
jgi:hypothetical protein